MRTLITLGALLTALTVALGQVEPRGENPAIRVNTLLGPTGLITVPTSTTARVERFQLGTAFGKDIRTVSLNWGIFDSIEVGGAVVDRNNQNNKVIATAKVAAPTTFAMATPMMPMPAILTRHIAVRERTPPYIAREITPGNKMCRPQRPNSDMFPMFWNITPQHITRQGSIPGA